MELSEKIMKELANLIEMDGETVRMAVDKSFHLKSRYAKAKNLLGDWFFKNSKRCKDRILQKHYQKNLRMMTRE